MVNDEPNDPVVQQVAEFVRTPVALREDFDEAVMERVARHERSRVAGRVTGDLSRPATRFLLAASIAAVMVGSAWIGRITAPATPAAPPSVATRSEGSVVEFVVLARGASTVNLVGDFNEWNTSATPLQATEREGVWSVKVPLPPGRHEYAFIVDGERWMPDPAAPRAQSDDFGTPNSVVTVMGQS